METLIHLLLYASVATALFSGLGVLLMRNVNDRLHYLGPSGTLSVSLVATAIALQEGASQSTTKAILCAVVVFVTNPVLTHAIARAARIREYGHWLSTPEDRRKAG